MEKYKVVDPKTGRSDYMYEHCAMQEQIPCIVEYEVINPTIDRFPIILGETCTYAVADTREHRFTFWTQILGPPVPLVDGRQVIRNKVQILTFLEVQALEPKLHPEQLNESIQKRFAGNRKKHNNPSPSLQAF